MLFLFLAFSRWWRLIFLSHRRSSGSASSTSLTLTAACRWSCFFLVRFAQFCELYCPFSFMPHVSCLVLHDSCIMPKASRGGGIHTCMIILPLCFCLTPLGFCSYFSFELSRPHLWRATLLSLALADGCGSHPQMEISGLFLSILLLMEVHFGSLRCLGGWRPCFVCRSGYSWLHVFPPCISPLVETHLPFLRSCFFLPVSWDILSGLWQVILLW